MDIAERIACSPGTAGRSFEESARIFSEMGFRNMELFSRGSSASRPDLEKGPGYYRDIAAEHGMRISSFHLPIVDEGQASFDQAVRTARFGKDMGAEVLLYNATSRDLIVATASRFLDAVDDLSIAVAVQNHPGRAIETAEDYQAVFDGVGDEPRLKAVLEVGSFHHYGVSWRQGYDLLEGRIALVHVKDMVGQQSVPFGTGEVDIPGLFGHMSSVGYEGKFVLEMSVVDKENTLKYTGQALQYVIQNCS